MRVEERDGKHPIMLGVPFGGVCSMCGVSQVVVVPEPSRVTLVLLPRHVRARQVPYFSTETQNPAPTTGRCTSHVTICTGGGIKNFNVCKLSGSFSVFVSGFPNRHNTRSCERSVLSSGLA